MARTWDEKNKDLQIKQREAGVNEVMMISKAHPPGELPPYVPPNKPSSPWEPGKSPAPSRQKLASTQIRPNQIMLPFVPKEAETDDMYGEGVDEVELKGLQAHGKYFDDYGRIKKKPRGMTPSGKPFDMPVDKKQQKKNKERHDRLYHSDLMISQSPAALDALRKGLTPGLSSKQIRSLIKPYTKQDQFGHPTGSLRGV